MNTHDTKKSAPDRVRLTERLRLEPIGPRHAKDLWLMHQDDAVALEDGNAGTIEASHRQAAEAADGWKMDGVHKWIAYDRYTNELIGRGGLSRMPAGAQTTSEMVAALAGSGWFDSRLEVGWNLRASHRGHGYATEIGHAGLIFAFDELGASHVVAFTETENLRSRAVMERLDMAYLQEVTQDGAPFALYVVGRRSSADEDKFDHWRTRQQNAGRQEPPAASRPELFHRLHMCHKLIEGDFCPLQKTRRFIVL